MKRKISLHLYSYRDLRIDRTNIEPEVYESLLSKLDLANALNDLAPSIGINTEYLPGDLLLCKLNLIKRAKPRRNPFYRP